MRPVQMSNSSPTIHERIRYIARREAYANARHLGYSGHDATAEANEVAAFIDRIAKEIEHG